MKNRARNVDWLGRMVFYGVMGLFFCWLPLLMATVLHLRYKSTFGKSEFRKVLEWELASYLNMIDEAVN